jgi:hypothetical protein
MKHEGRAGIVTRISCKLIIHMYFNAYHSFSHGHLGDFLSRSHSTTTKIEGCPDSMGMPCSAQLFHNAYCCFHMTLHQKTGGERILCRHRAPHCAHNAYCCFHMLSHPLRILPAGRTPCNTASDMDSGVLVLSFWAVLYTIKYDI